MLRTIYKLGDLSADQSKLGKAEGMYWRALEGCEKALGRDHTSTLSTVNNLSNLYRSQGKLDKAEEMYRRAMEGYKKALRRDHTSALITANNLGNLYRSRSTETDIVGLAALIIRSVIAF
jgi:tetratricopeptide (TPR) repeat protein